MRRFTDQHQPRSPEPLEQRPEILALDRFDRLGDFAHEVNQGCRAARGLRGTPVPLGWLRHPALSPDQRHEAHVAELFLANSAIRSPSHPEQALDVAALPHRDDEATARRQLVQERLGHLRAPRRDDDRVVRRVLGPAERAVAMEHRDVRESETGKPLGRDACQLLVPLDGVDLVSDPAENRRRVTRPRPHLQHTITGAERRRRRHQRDDVRLRDRLPALDRQGRIRVRELLELRGEKRLARDTPHRREHGRITDAPGGDVRADHLLSRV